MGTVSFAAKIIVLVCNLCRAKASPNRRGADEGGGEVNGLNFINNLWIISTCEDLQSIESKFTMSTTQKTIFEQNPKLTIV